MEQDHLSYGHKWRVREPRTDGESFHRHCLICRRTCDSPGGVGRKPSISEASVDFLHEETTRDGSRGLSGRPLANELTASDGSTYLVEEQRSWLF